MRGPLTFLAGLALTFAGGYLTTVGALTIFERPLTTWYWSHWTR